MASELNVKGGCLENLPPAAPELRIPVQTWSPPPMPFLPLALRALPTLALAFSLALRALFPLVRRLRLGSLSSPPPHISARVRLRRSGTRIVTCCSLPSWRSCFCSGSNSTCKVRVGGLHRGRCLCHLQRTHDPHIAASVGPRARWHVQLGDNRLRWSGRCGRRRSGRKGGRRGRRSSGRKALLHFSPRGPRSARVVCTARR